MARLLTAGAETLNAIGDDKSMEGSITTSGTVTVDTATVYTGSKSFKCDSGAGNVAAYVEKVITPVLGTIFYGRVWLRFPVLPSAGANVVELSLFASADFQLRLTTTGTVEARHGGSLQATSSALSVNTWYCIEAAIQNNTVASTGYREARIDGVSFYSTSTWNASSVGTGYIRFGWQGAQLPGANTVINCDDLAINDSAGGNQNSWPGLSKQVLLLPTADSAIGTGWTLGSGGTTNLWDAVNNIPPAGVADAGATAQIRNASANANVNYDATMTTYSAAGIGATDTINLIDPIIWTAAPVTTSSKQGTVGVASNPAITNVALAAGGTAGAFWSGATAGTYATGWKLSHGTLTYAPSVTVGTAPVMRVTQVTSSTRIAMVCFMGIYVDYTPGPPLPYRNPMPPLIAQ